MKHTSCSDIAPSLFGTEGGRDLLNLRQASFWASEHLNKTVTPTNISYLVQYGRIKKYVLNGVTAVSKSELSDYYENSFQDRESDWKNKLGHDLNWNLSFDFLREKDTTKHVHRFHPYKGKFIPQLVEYFLDEHTDNYKKTVFFRPGDTVLDPFCGSGTTLVQANELGVHAIGIDISSFNTLISNVKMARHDMPELEIQLQHIQNFLIQFRRESVITTFDQVLSEELKKFNKIYFPSPDYKRKVRLKEIDEKSYSSQKEKQIKDIYFELFKKYEIYIEPINTDSYLNKWYLKPVRDELDALLSQITRVDNLEIQRVLQIILSRTARSCRATTHSDLATLKDPVTTPYYCKKHGKICRPVLSVYSWWKRYSRDTLTRISEFNCLRTGTSQICLQGDSRSINLVEALRNREDFLSTQIRDKGIQGIFTSPPYVGLIDYHEQHAYAYELFDYERNDQKEIGPLFRGQGVKAREIYSESIAEVLRNCKKYLAVDFNIFLVANDKYNLYPGIANLSGMQIVDTYKRPVLNRTERDKGAYSETIFHLK